jgi:DNA-binding CsgD family transcriptional regulator
MGVGDVSDLRVAAQSRCNGQLAPDLTPRQRETLTIYGRLGNGRMVARHMGLSVVTVYKHLAEARARLGTTTNVAAAVLLAKSERE